MIPLDVWRMVCFFLEEKDRSKLDFLFSEEDIIWKLRIEDEFNISVAKAYNALRLDPGKISTKILHQTLKEKVARDYDFQFAYQVLERYDIFMSHKSWPELLGWKHDRNIKKYINVKDKSGDTLLLIACRNYIHSKRYLEEIQWFIYNGADPNLQNGKTPLMHIAAKPHHQEAERVMKMLLDAGANPRLREQIPMKKTAISPFSSPKKGKTALEIAQENNAPPNIIKLLQDAEDYYV